MWHNAIGFDEFLGQEVFSAATDTRNEVMELGLRSKDKGSDATLMPGRLYFAITTSRDLAGV